MVHVGKIVVARLFLLVSKILAEGRAVHAGLALQQRVRGLDGGERGGVARVGTWLIRS